MGVLTLKNRTAIVTGGTRGIGYEVAKKFLDAGMNVAVIGTNEIGISKAVKTLQGQKALCRGYVCDVTSVQEIEKTLRLISEDFSVIDVLVNNAGILDVSKIGTLSEEQWDKVLDVNLKGCSIFGKI
jgi:3-oxoacyl-[acyl-carrier protein] reductase